MTISCMQCGVRLDGASVNLRCLRCGSARDGSSRMLSRSSLASAGEGSGLIDLRAMQAGLAGRELAAVVPVLGGLAPTLPVTPPRPTTRSQARLPASQLPLYSVIVALTLGLATLAAHVLTRPSAPPPVRVELPAIVAAAPIVAAAEEVEAAPEPEPAVEAVSEAPEEVAKPEKPGKPGKSVKPVVKVVKPTPEVTPEVAVKPKPTPVEPDDSVDCLLGRKQCGGPRREPEAPEVAVAPVGSELPAMLEQSDISALTSAGRAAALEACGGMSRGGERVKLRLSIAGPSGSITGTTVVDDAGNAQLAACAAQEVGRLPVKKVQKPQIGAMLTLKF